MSNELDDLAKSLFNGQLPNMWRRLAPATKKTLGNWMDHFFKRNNQYINWVKIRFFLKATLKASKKIKFSDK